jgi:hypothetical protein
MKPVLLDTESTSLHDAIAAAEEGRVVFLTKDGETRFALLPADDGDREACSLRSNAEFMEFLTELEERARTRPRKSLREICERYDLPVDDDIAPETRSDDLKNNPAGQSTAPHGVPDSKPLHVEPKP